MKIKTVFLLAAFFLSLPSILFAGEAEERGLAIAREADRRDSGFQDNTAELEMILRNRQGEESTRKMRIMVLEVKDDGDKSLMVFDSPRDVAGTAFLTYSHKRGDDDQWLFLPALKRVKRISSRNKSGSFMGSEFSYEDIASQEVEKYTYKFLREESCQELECLVSERYPVDRENSGYSRQVVWMDKEEYRPWKIEYYDRKNALLKTLIFKDYQHYLDKFWRASLMEMVNHQTGKSTVLEWSNFHFKTGLSDRDFDKNSLKRAR
jgi:outer membrane lipoprotein-sorting protein